MVKRQPQDLASQLGKRKPFASLKQETYLNLLRTCEQLSSGFVKLLKKHGLSDAQYNALRILRGESKPMQIYQIAERMIVAQPDISRLIDRLRKTGLVACDRCEQDRRVVWVTLTVKARELLKKIDRPIGELHEAQFDRLSETELATLNKLLFRAQDLESPPK